MNSPSASSLNLPHKETNLFRSILRFYEFKQYKKGLKVSEQLLRKFPTHAETMAMKGLFLALLDRPQEGFKILKESLRIAVQSPVCWHVFGLYHRNAKNYEEAIKCYKCALRFDSENLSIVRDLALLQLQCRDPGLIETRWTLLENRNDLLSNWTSLAIAYYSLGDLENSLKVLNCSIRAWGQQLDDMTKEQFLFCRVRLLYCLERYQDALDLLSTHQSVPNQFLYLTEKAKMLDKLGQSEKSLPIWSRLFSCENENKLALDRIVSIKGPEVIDEFIEKYPKSVTVLEKAFSCFDSEAKIRQLLESKICKLLDKKIPFAFVLLESLTLQWPKLIETFLLSGNEKSEGFVIARSRYFSLFGDCDRSIAEIDSICSLESQDPDNFYQFSKILKKFGFLSEASAVMSKASEMNPNDRFLNSMATEANMLANGPILETEKLASKFLHKKTLNDMNDMQAIWYTHNRALFHQRVGDHKEALKYFRSLLKFFDEFQDDQFDFHNYVHRKTKLTAYFDLLDWEDNIWCSDAYFKCAYDYLIAISDFFSSIEAAFDSVSLKDDSTSSNDENVQIGQGIIKKLLHFRSDDPKTHFASWKFYCAIRKPIPAMRSIIRHQNLGGKSVALQQWNEINWVIPSKIIGNAISNSLYLVNNDLNDPSTPPQSPLKLDLNKFVNLRKIIMNDESK